MEGALAAWRRCSLLLDFDPGPGLLTRFSAFALLVDGKVQEALDFATMAEQSSTAPGANDEAFAGFLKPWVALCCGLCDKGEPMLQRKCSELNDLSTELFLGSRSSRELCSDVNESWLSKENMRFMVHSTVSLLSHKDGLAILQKLKVTSRVCWCGFAFYRVACMAAFVATGVLEENAARLVTTDISPLLLVHFLSMPLAYSMKGGIIFSGGLETFRYLFCEGEFALAGVSGELNSQFSCKTVGTLLFQRLLDNGLVDSFLHAVITHDLNRADPLLLATTLRVQLGPGSSALPSVLGCKLINYVRTALESSSLTGTRHLLMLGYVSRVLGPFLCSKHNQRYRMEYAVNNTSIACSSIFYIELLRSVLVEIPSSSLKPWRRFVQHVVRTIIQLEKSGCGDVIWSALQFQLHKRWFLPDLLLYVDSAREGRLCNAFQHFLSCDSGEWGLFLHAIIEACERDAPRPRDTVDWNTPSSCGARRSFVRRVLRWEWLLKSIWKFLSGKRENDCNIKWEDILYVCSKILSDCRAFHRGDIARELLSLLFLPSAPLLGAVKPGELRATTSLLALLLTWTDGEKVLTGASMAESQWHLLKEVSHWFGILHALGRFREPLELLQEDPDCAHRRITLFKNYINSLSVDVGKSDKFDSDRRRQMRDLVHCYNEMCRHDITLRAPQVLSPLAGVLRRAGLLNPLEMLVRDTFLELESFFSSSYGARAVLEGLLLLHDRHVVAVARIKGDDSQRVANCRSFEAMRAVWTFAEAYLFMLMECGHMVEVETILLGPVIADDTRTPVPSCPSFSRRSSSLPSSPVDVALLLPLAAREAMRVLLALYLAHQRSVQCWSVLERLSPFTIKYTGTRTAVNRLVIQEKHLFGSFKGAAINVASGTLPLEDAITNMYNSRRVEAMREPLTMLDLGEAKGQTLDMRGLNDLIDSGDWAAALRVIPLIITTPLHMARKALAACEAASPGASWEGAMGIFVASTPSYFGRGLEYQQHGERTHLRPTMEVGEIGRVMTLLASAKRWRESLMVFECIPPCDIDSYVFSQVCFALRISGHSQFAVDLWATWRAIVGDRVAPTEQMCGQFLSCGVAGDTAVADAACLMLKEAARANSSPEAVVTRRNSAAVGGGKSSLLEVPHTPGTSLPLSFGRREAVVIALLRDRWSGSWQEALQIAFFSGRSNIVQKVAWNSPHNPYIYEAILKWASHERRLLSTEERCAISGHLDVNAVSGKDEFSRVKQVVEELLGDEDD
uniref:WGS project CAEQ00000000 data, annotated contig 1888 n=1 Tax=Trypanosoma congolense (strain IL3000) TaxID=1068625 RepID=F9W9R6_TRYCI|nr:unnamed protein product [Trypanosoma congolense IL3000]